MLHFGMLLLTPASCDAPPSTSFVQMLGDFCCYTLTCLLETTNTLPFAINQRCLILAMTTLPWLGTSHFAKYPVSGLSFHLGMVLSSSIICYSRSSGNLPFPLPPSTGSEGEKGGMLSWKLTLFIYQGANAADKQRDSFWCQPTLNLFAC